MGSVAGIVDEVEEGVELGGDDDFGAAVGGADFGSFALFLGQVLAAAAGDDTGGREAIGDEDADDFCGPHHAEVPVVFDVAEVGDGDIVGMAFDHDADVILFLQGLGKFAEGGAAVCAFRR